MGYAPGCVLYAKLLSIYMWNGGKEKKKKSLSHKARPGFILPVIFPALNCIQAVLGIKQICISPFEFTWQTHCF